MFDRNCKSCKDSGTAYFSMSCALQQPFCASYVIRCEHQCEWMRSTLLMDWMFAYALKLWMFMQSDHNCLAVKHNGIFINALWNIVTVTIPDMGRLVHMLEWVGIAIISVHAYSITIHVHDEWWLMFHSEGRRHNH